MIQKIPFLNLFPIAFLSNDDVFFKFYFKKFEEILLKVTVASLTLIYHHLVIRRPRSAEVPVLVLLEATDFIIMIILSLRNYCGMFWFTFAVKGSISTFFISGVESDIREPYAKLFEHWFLNFFLSPCRNFEHCESQFHLRFWLRLFAQSIMIKSNQYSFIKAHLVIDASRSLTYEETWFISSYGSYLQSIPKLIYVISVLESRFWCSKTPGYNLVYLSEINMRRGVEMSHHFGLASSLKLSFTFLGSVGFKHSDNLQLRYQDYPSFDFVKVKHPFGEKFHEQIFSLDVEAKGVKIDC